MGRRVHLTGSASSQCDLDLLRWTHRVLRSFLRAHLRGGGSLIAQLGGEPYHLAAEDLPCTFDWLAIEVALEALRVEEVRPSAEDPLVLLRGSRRGFEQIPPQRRPLYDELVDREAVDLQLLPDTWRSGALIRQAQARLGDVLVIASGGAGVEHLADMYTAHGRAVVPWDVDLGSSGDDGALRGVGLARKALVDSSSFFCLATGGGAEARLLQLKVDTGNVGDAEATGSRLASLVGDLELTPAFCVRLLNPSVPLYTEVEKHFRTVVDPVLDGLGYRVVDLGRERQEAAWMNDEIFRQLDRAPLAFCDLTAQRSNCFTELGYALGNRQRVILSAHDSERLPFDTDKLSCRFWNQSEPIDVRRERLLAHINQFGTLPPIVQAASLL
ncbi:MAG TPA: hypothetical protein VK680_07075 [Solirubrobacteraceae bacterium]|nr:hypothetical protein [Solirubrobacteraceae bacterium]